MRGSWEVALVFSSVLTALGSVDGVGVAVAVASGIVLIAGSVDGVGVAVLPLVTGFGVGVGTGTFLLGDGTGTEEGFGALS
ncbi:hypothetical protein BH11PAT4_BH11PAT4_8420 [soil metagenome]